MVHWPESMAIYDAAEKVLFSSDIFGAFGALDGSIFDDELELASLEDEFLRYFSNIVGKYAAQAAGALEKLQGLEIRTIAPAHGLVWRKDPSWVLERYGRWSRFEAEEGALLVFASMYGNTERMMEAVARGLSEGGLPAVRICDASRTHVSYLLRDAWRFRGLVIGGPTYDAGLFPPLCGFVELLEQKKLADRVFGLFGSFGWSGGSVRALAERGKAMGWELAEPEVEVRGAPTPKDLERCVLLGRDVARRLKAHRS